MIDWPRISGIISDLDGITYRGDRPIETAVSAFQAWKDVGLPYAFVTNNSTKSAEQFSEKLNGMGIPASPDQVITTSAVTAETLTELLVPGARVMVIGACALSDAVRSRGFELADTDIAAVVAGLDRSFTFEKLAKAQTALLGGALFIGTNPDPMVPHGCGFEPGAGSILRAIETASGVSPTIVGKPEPNLVYTALKVLGTEPAETFMLGDQVTTDIAAGHAAGIPTILVRTGVHEVEPFPVQPDFDIQTLAELPLSANAT